MSFSDAFSLISASSYPFWMFLLVLVDFLTGVGSALKRGKFDIGHLADVFPKNVLNMLLATGAQALGAMQTDASVSQIITPAIFAVFAATILKSIWENIQELGVDIGKPATPTST